MLNFLLLIERFFLQAHANCITDDICLGMYSRTVNEWFSIIQHFILRCDDYKNVYLFGDDRDKFSLFIFNFRDN